VLVLHSGYGASPLVDADALVFLGASADGGDGDVLIVSVGLREPHGLGRARFGRFILATGAVHPTHIDGVSALGRTRGGSTLELFAGMPVVPELGPRDFDWLAGGRIGQELWDERLGLGASYVQRRDAGQLDDEEVGADLHAAPLPWLDLLLLGSFDLLAEGLSEARFSAQGHDGPSRLELYGSQRVASRLLPATSLFSVVGDAPSSELGTDGTWNAFPRLDLGATLALLALDGTLGSRAGARVTLRLTDEPGSLGGDIALALDRRELDGDGLTGVSIRTQWPMGRRIFAHATVELVAPDAPGDDGSLWPWARVGARYALATDWTLAAALGGRASPVYRHEVEGLVRVSYAAGWVP